MDFLQFSAMTQFSWLQRLIPSASAKMIDCNAPNAKIRCEPKRKITIAKPWALPLLRCPKDADFVEQASAI
jgi:hypothetical protein